MPKNNNLIILPHIGGATFEAMEVTQDFIAELVFKDFKNKKLHKKFKITVRSFWLGLSLALRAFGYIFCLP